MKEKVRSGSLQPAKEVCPKKRKVHYYKKDAKKLHTFERIESLCRLIKVVEEAGANLSQVIHSSGIALELNHSTEIAHIRTHVTDRNNASLKEPVHLISKLDKSEYLLHRLFQQLEAAFEQRAR